jgi:hypothetical protein
MYPNHSFLIQNNTGALNISTIHSSAQMWSREISSKNSNRNES